MFIHYLLFKKKLDSLLQHWQWLLAMLDRHVQHWGQEESFPCPFGLFQLKGMPFGINNVPSTLRKVMDVTIGDLRGWICIFCLDDNTDTIFFFSLQAILDINEVCQTHFQTQTLPNVIPGPLVTLLMEKKNVDKIVCQKYKSGSFKLVGKMDQSF